MAQLQPASLAGEDATIGTGDGDGGTYDSVCCLEIETDGEDEEEDEVVAFWEELALTAAGCERAAGVGGGDWKRGDC